LPSKGVIETANFNNSSTQNVANNNSSGFENGTPNQKIRPSNNNKSKSPINDSLKEEYDNIYGKQSDIPEDEDALGESYDYMDDIDKMKVGNRFVRPGTAVAGPSTLNRP